MTKEKNVMNNKNDVNEESRFKVYVYQNLPLELASRNCQKLASGTSPDLYLPSIL